jgi:EAL domain-containing protein (putative c-di-GMP-specific phosphodiesterase class I)
MTATLTPGLANAEQLSLLLVGDDPVWLDAAQSAADERGARLDVKRDVPTALAWMLRPERVHTHVLAIGPLEPWETDALAGMLDEVTMQPTRLLLLGSDAGHGNMIQPVFSPSLLDAGLRRPWKTCPAGLPALAAVDLAHSLHRGNLRMRFQPIVDATTLVPIGIEALARLHHPERGILHPSEFIPIAIASHQERVLTAIATARTMLELPNAPQLRCLAVTMNVPLPTLLNRNAVARAKELCAIAAIPPEQIMIEAVETPTRPDLHDLAVALERWRAGGFRVAIDDAGPALPHWRDLLSLPFSALKLDGTIANDASLTDEIVDAAKQASLFVIAEGIESDATAARLRGLGVDALQGFLFSRPLPLIAVPLWMEQHAACSRSVRNFWSI